MALSMDQLNIKDWGVEETCQYLRKKKLHQFEDRFREKKLTAVILRDATLADMALFGFEDKSDITKVLDCFRELWKTAVQGKVFNDPIHGHVELHPLLVKIIDTPQFQRLRYIKQLGGTYFVFPGASHNRFEHSIGVGYLAGLLAQVLSTKQEHLGITPEDILCVQIAGLCHDLGHGPFSKVFEEMFISEKRPDWKCKKASADMFDLLMKREDLRNAMMHYKLDLTKDVDFIKEMIRGPEDTTAEAEWPYKGRTEDKSFLYEIVANEKNGIDVVKFDYLARDCYHLGIPLGFDYRRCLKFARVCKVNERRHICFRDKELNNLCNMFYTRSNLHRYAYQHKASKIIQIMIRDAFLTADEHIQIEGSEGKKFTLSMAINDLEAYTKLTDNVFETILNSSSNLPEAIKMLQEEYEKASAQEKQDPHMKKKKEIIDKALKFSEEMAQARQILQRIVSRKIYGCLGKKNTKEPTKDMIQSWKNDLAISPPEGDIDQVTLRPKDLEIVPFNTGPGNQQHENFIKNTYFYRKSDPNKAFQFPPNEVSMRLPKLMSEQFVMVYCKNSDEEVVDAAKKKFDQWVKGQDSQDGGEATPNTS